MVVMKIKLYKDSAGALHAEFLDGLNSVSQNNSNVNGVLVMLDNFDLMPEEVLRIAYELESGAEVDDYTLMEDNGDGTYSAEVRPAVMRSDVGTKWFLGLQIASDWVENNEYTGYLHKQNLVSPLPFTVNNAVKDLNGKYPNRGDLTALYQEAQKKIAHEENNAQEIENVKETIATAPLALISPIDFGGKAINEYSFSSLATTWFNRQPRVGDAFYAVGVNVGEDERSYYLLCQIENHNKEEDTVSATCYQTLPVVGGKLVETIKNNSSSISIQSEKIQEHSEAIGKNSNAIREVSTEVSNANNDIFLMRMQLQETTAQHVSDIEGLRQDIINESHFRGYFLNNVDVQNTQGNANDYAYSAESGTKWIYNATVGHWLDSGVPVPAGGVPASNATPLMDGEASAGQEGAYARGDHRHPSDTSKVSKTGDTMTGPLSVAKDDYDKTTLHKGGVTIKVGDPYVPDEFPTSYSHHGIEHDGRTIYFPRARWNTPTEDNPTAEKLDETIAMLSDLHAILPTNIQSGAGNGAVQQVADGSVVIAYSWDFTGRNANAEADDPSLSGPQPYGGVGKYSATFGGINSAQGGRSFAVNNKTIAKGDESFAQGYCSVAEGPSSFAGGTTTYAKGEASVALGSVTQALADYAVALGSQTKASGVASFAGGVLSYAIGYASFSYGNGAKATGESSWASGEGTLAQGNYSYATGWGAKALGQSSFAEGWNTEASGDSSHAQGSSTKAIGPSSHAGGVETIAGYDSQTAIGRYNDNKEENIFEVGNGDHSKRSNAFEVRKDGSAAYVGGKKLLTEDDNTGSSGGSGGGGTKLYKHTITECIDPEFPDGAPTFIYEIISTNPNAYNHRDAVKNAWRNNEILLFTIPEGKVLDIINGQVYYAFPTGGGSDLLYNPMYLNGVGDGLSDVVTEVKYE